MRILMMVIEELGTFGIVMISLGSIMICVILSLIAGSRIERSAKRYNR